jgi:methyl-accepting chemotaxis protein
MTLPNTVNSQRPIVRSQQMFTFFSLRNFTIRTRMIGAIGMVLALLLLVSAAGLLGIRHVDAIGAEFIENTHGETVTLAQLRTEIGNVRRFEKDLLINYNSSSEQTAYLAKWHQSVAVSHRAAQTLTNSRNAVEAKAATKIDAYLTAYTEASIPLFKQIESGSFNDASVANRALEKAQALAALAEEQVMAVQTALDSQASSSAQARETAAQRSYAVSGAALVVAVLLVVPLTLLNMVSICRPIDQSRQLAERIATGDLSGAVIDQGQDETAGLLRALAAMQDSLRGIVGQVRDSADSIQLASAEVASGNIDLSQRTEQAASNLQQTAGSLEQLTGNVRQSADAAAQANQLAASASTVAERGGQVVSQVVGTMDEINAASKKIADIVGTIDGIAFQTNILALNAAVEAARAGEQGRGFAVVASEVRSLAQRSAEAAREIKTLIGTSVTKVDAGTRLVRDAGSTMGEIVASVQRVTDVIGEITAAAAEQSQGISEVNQAVTQLDQMTQQNAALVEQSAAAAESLREQAQRLAGVVGTFELDAPAQAKPPSALALRLSANANAKKAMPAKAQASPAHVAHAVIFQARTSSRPAAPAAADDWESF